MSIPVVADDLHAPPPLGQRACLTFLSKIDDTLVASNRRCTCFPPIGFIPAQAGSLPDTSLPALRSSELQEKPGPK
jgi:hypothetical protein